MTDDASSPVAETGLTREQARARLTEFGPNALPEPPQATLAVVFGRQFLSPFIYILIVAAAASLALGQVSNGVFIVAVLLLNAGIGTVQEFSAQRAAVALRKMVTGTVTVVRDGQQVTVPVGEIVPGDLVQLGSGDKVPADLRLLRAQNLLVDESSLTGESNAVAKNPAEHSDASTPLAEIRDHLFAGTMVTHGRASGTVVATGLKTRIGEIASEVTERAVAEPPLVRRMQAFTRTVALAILGAIALLFGVMFLGGHYGTEDMVLMAVGLAVSAIPEGLPAAVTVALAIGMQRMARAHVIIRKLVAVEALGSCTYICSDKTGTLTVNELTIKRIVLPDGSRFDVDGQGMTPEGEVAGEGDRHHLSALCTTGALANEAALTRSAEGWRYSGDAVDAAFLVLCHKAGLDPDRLRSDNPRADLMPYESERAWSGSLHHHPEGRLLHVKGSLERVALFSSHMRVGGELVPFDHARIEAQAMELAREGYRVLALASLPQPGTLEIPDAPSGLVFLGLAAMIDPLRPEARDAVVRCKQAGIEVAMITGDHPETARAISLELGLIHPGDPVVTGSMLREAAPEAVPALVRDCHVFARIEPDQKRQIVQCLIDDGHFVAVTGDGVNDAPALRHANVGIAMGLRGTDVARETADLILTDDNFASIVRGIEQGRIVYNNIRKVIALLLATGASAILLFFLSALLGLPMPLTAVQLLWLNLVANGVQDVALAFEPAEGDELSSHARSPREPVFERHLMTDIIVNGLWMGLVAFGLTWSLDMAGVDEHAMRNLVLMLMVLFGNVHVLNSRSETRSVFRTPLFSNRLLIAAVVGAQAIHIGAMYTPGLSSVLGIAPISLGDWLELLGLAVTLVGVGEFVKWLHRRSRRVAGT